MILVLNAGSSSLKCRVFDGSGSNVLISALVSEIGRTGGSLRVDLAAGRHEQPDSSADIAGALRQIRPFLDRHPEMVIHRVVFGGELPSPALLDVDSIRQIRELIPRAPLHNPGNLAAIEAALELFPGTRNYAVMDSYHTRDLPAAEATLAIPADWRAAGFRRIGFHGISHSDVYFRIARPNQTVISAHLGSGCSVTTTGPDGALATSMGYTPLGGLMMGTRSGDLDPGTVFALIRHTGDAALAEQRFWKETGLTAIAGTGDMRRITQSMEAGDADAALAFEIFCRRTAGEIARQRLLVSGEVTLAFTGGIGENSGVVRARILELLAPLGFIINDQANRSPQWQNGIAGIGSGVLVVQADEESAMVRAVLQG